MNVSSAWLGVAGPFTKDSMKPIPFKHCNKELQPSGKKYSANVTDVQPLPIWTDGEQCVSCWQMTWRERFAALFRGRVWLAMLTGKTQPPACLSVEKEYVREATPNEKLTSGTGESAA